MRKKITGGHSTALIVCVNLLLVAGIAVVFLLYSTGYRASLRAQNLADISNINRSSADIGSAFFQNQKKRLADMTKYITLRGFDRDEALAYIFQSNSDAGSVYELVGSDSRGYAAIRSGDGFVPVDYTNSDYAEFDRAFAPDAAAPDGGILCTCEFTDACTAKKSFALYTRLQLPADGGSVPWTLLAVSRSSEFAGLIELDGGYRDLDTVLVTQSGDYVFGSQNFKAANLFRYFYDYNDLTRDEMKQAQAAFQSAGSGILYYRDSRGRDCAFAFCEVPETQWYCVSSVPLSSFRGSNLDLRFTLWIALFLLALMGFNLSWLNGANRRLRLSVQKEKEAGAAKTDFLSRMSHDIRTPLNGIIGADILARREDNPSATRKYLEDIDQSGKFLLSLVNDILDLNKVESGKMELHPVPCSFGRLASNIGAIIAPLCRDRDLAFTVTGDETPGAWLLDSMRVEQILFNILSNSVKFTPPGGHVSLAFSAEAGPEKRDTLCFVCSDDGQGMSEEFQRHMFEAFSQEGGARRDGQGTGLGLAIVKNLVELMDGTLLVDSAPGRGTRFTITLAAERTAELPADVRETEVSAGALEGRRVLLFEDNEINAEIAETLLTDGGMLVERAANGRQGVEMFEALPLWHFDAILMDLRMPVMDGLEAARAIRALRRDDAAAVPIIAMTANAYDVDVQNCLDAGMNAHLPKPIEPKLMFSTLAREIAAAEKRRR